MEDEEDIKGKNQSEDSMIIKMYKESKIGLFNIASTMLTQENFRIEIRILLIIIETMQILHFYFKKPLFILWKQEDEVDIISKITSYTVLTPIFSELGWSQYIVFFWINVGILILILLSITVVLYSLKKKISGQEGFIKILKGTTDLLCSIAFLPSIEIYMHVFYCEKKGDKWFHRSFDTTQCYSGEQSSYTFVGGLLGFVLCFYTCIMAFINFECRYSSKNCFTKTSGRGDVLFIIYKTMCAIFLTIFVQEEYQIVLIVGMLFYSTLLFSYFNFNVYYNNDVVSKVITCMYSINLWAVLMLILAFITESYDFSYSVYLFLLGVPVIIYIITVRVEQKYEIILLNSNNYKSIDLAQTQLLYLTKLLQNYNKNPQVKTILNGFLDYHRTICNIEDCPSKTRLMKITNFSKQLREEGESETLITVISVIQSMFYTGLQKFPNSTRLRILYALYLLDITRSKQQAIQELNNAQLEIPLLDEEFIIFRYRTIIENELMSGSGNKSSSKGGEQNESVNELSIQNYLTACRNNIEKSSASHTEFWSQLQDQTPDLGKLSDLGFRINILNQKVDEFYNKLIQLTHCMPAIQRYYAKFLIQILHDKEKGHNILEKMIFSNNKGGNMIDMENESKATIFISAEDDSFCQIKNANLSVEGLLGYSKIEVINRNIKVVMPNLYAQYHNSFIYNYLNTLEPRVLGQERILPAKDKQDYIYPIQTMVRNVPSLIHGLQFSAQVYMEKHLLQICHLVTNLDGEVLNCSTTAITILDINSKKVSKNKYTVQEIIPDFFDNIGNEKEGILSKHGVKLQCNNLKIRKKPKAFEGSVSAQIISFRMVNDQGYLVKIEKFKPHLTPEKEAAMIINDRKLPNHLHLHYDKEKRVFYGQMQQGAPTNINQTVMGDVSASRINSDMDRSKLILQQEVQNQQNKNYVEGEDSDTGSQVQPGKTNYGDKIKMCRLVDNKITDIDQLKSLEEEVIEQLDADQEYILNSQGGNQYGADDEDEGKGYQVQKLFNRKHIFFNFIKDSGFLNVKAIRTLKYYSFGVVLIMYLLSLLNYFIIANVLDQSEDRYNLIAKQYKQISGGQFILSSILELYAHNKFNSTSPNQTHIDEQKEDIKMYLQEFIEIQNDIQLNDLSISKDHEKLFQEDVVPMRFMTDNNNYEKIMFDLHEATQQIITKTNQLVNKDLSQYTTQNVDFNFLQYNLFNNYYMSSVDSADYYVEELDQWAEEKQGIFIFFLIAAIVFNLIALCLIIPQHILILDSQKQVLTLFLDIPQTQIKQLFKSCEEFSKSAQQGNEEDINSDERLANTQEDDDDQMTLVKGKGKKRKKFRMNHKNNKVFYVPFFLSSVIFMTYFFLSFSLSNQISNKFTIFIQEMNYTNKAESYFGFSNNALRQLLIHSNYTILEKQMVQKYVNNSISDLYNIMSGIQQQYTQNIDEHQTMYIEAFQNVMAKNQEKQSCDVLVERKNVSQSQCQEFMEGTVLQGFSVAIARHIENFRKSLALYDHEITQDETFGNNGTLFNQQIIQDMRNMQKDYIQNLFRHLIQKFEESLKIQYNDNNGTKVTLLITSLIFLLVIYLILWIPLISNINMEITRIRSMITMIPLDICKTTPAIKNMLAAYITHNYDQ